MDICVQFHTYSFEGNFFMVNVRQFRFETGPVTLHNPHLIEIDPIQLRKRGIEEYSVDMMLNDSEAKSLWAAIEVVRENCLSHLPTQSKLKIPGQLDKKTGLIKFTARAYAKYGQPDVCYAEDAERNNRLGIPPGKVGVVGEVPHGARARCFGSISPYTVYSGGIRLVIKKVALIWVTRTGYSDFRLVGMSPT
jgi:hypothetical protein